MMIRRCCSRLPYLLSGVVVWLAFSVGVLAAEPDYFVAVDGNDAWSGKLAAPSADRTDGPFASLEQAQRAVRGLKQASPERDRPIVVAIRGGTYWLAAPLSFGPEDSGAERAPIVYQALGDERPILSGGRPLNGWKVEESGRWSVDLPEVKNGEWNFCQLFVADQRRFRPQLPKHGYYKIATDGDATPEAGGKGFNRFGFFPGELDPNWANLSDVEVMPFHSWTASRLPIASIDAAGQKVTVSGHTAGTSSWAAFRKGNRYLAVNVREALTEPGEWYLDRPSGRLTYLATPGEDPQRTEVIAPRLRYLVLLAGDLANRRWVQHVHLRGLTFAHSNWATPREGQAFPQAEVNLGAAVAATAARHIVIENCAIRHTGEYGLAFGPGCQHNGVEGCELVDLGAGGIKIGNALPSEWGDTLAPPRDDEALVSHHTIRNCCIAHGGRLHPAGIGVWIGHSPYNVIEHNDVYDFYYSAFSVGWVWGYAQSRAHHNTIGFNHAYRIGQGVLSDMGCIYTLGVSPGTVIHNNHFHDVTSFDYGGWGLYTDEGSTGVVMKSNLVYRCSRGSFHQHYGKENRVENNILAFGGAQQLQRTRTEEHLSFFFERNIVFWDNDNPLMGSNWTDNNFRLDHNLYFRVGGQPVTFPGGLTLEQWQTQRGQDQHSLVADPLFVDPAKDDFRLKPDSPALKLGFVPFDPSQAGRQSPLALTKDLPDVPPAFE